MNTELPPLPEPTRRSCKCGDVLFYTADQMREYALAARAGEQEQGNQEDLAPASSETAACLTDTDLLRIAFEFDEAAGFGRDERFQYGTRAVLEMLRKVAAETQRSQEKQRPDGSIPKSALACIECGNDVQWRCTACKISQLWPPESESSIEGAVPADRRDLLQEIRYLGADAVDSAYRLQNVGQAHLRLRQQWELIEALSAPAAPEAPK